MTQKDIFLSTVSLGLALRQVMNSEHISQNTKEVIKKDMKRINARLKKAQQIIESLILQQNSGVGVKPLFYYSNIPTHNSRVIYNHS